MRDSSVLAHHLQPLNHLMATDDITELVINRPGEIGVERSGRWIWHDAPGMTEAWLRTLATAAAAWTGQDVSAEHPICSTTLPGEERVQIVLPPVASAGCPSLTIRKPSQAALSLRDFASGGVFDAVSRSGAKSLVAGQLARLHEQGDWIAFFDLAVKSRCNILVSGATGSGKTTFAKGLIQRIPLEERLLTIEDTREFVVPHRNVVHMIYAKDGQGQARVGPKALLESALRMRPDRILLQELRDESAFFFLRNVASGHPGSITTIHADSAALAFDNLTLLIRESSAGRELPAEDLSRLLGRLIDVVVQMRKIDGRFRVTEVWFEPDR